MEDLQENSNIALIVSADEIKKTLPGYTPSKVEQLHRKSTLIADKQFYAYINQPKPEKVMLLNGGTASGKTEFMMTQLVNRNAVILDSTMPSIDGARTKIKKSLRKGKTVEIFVIIPDDLQRAFIAFLNRDRKFSDEHFYRTHSCSRETALWVSERYPDIKITLVESSYNRKERLQFAKLVFEKRLHLVEYLKSIQVNKDDIINHISI